MHISEKLSLDCGVNSIQPKIPLGFFPLSSNNLIILENSKSNEEYLHFEEVINYMSSLAVKKKRELIQIKINPQDKTLDRCKPYSQLSLPQFNWLIKNADLLISNNPYSCAVASALNVKAIQIHKNFPEKSFKHIWGKELKANFTQDGKLYAEKIVKEALSMIGESSEKINQVEPIFCGKNFHTKCIEVVPDFSENATPIQNENINIRADYYFNERKILQLIHLNNCNLITKKALNPKLIESSTVKERLKNINFEVTSLTEEREIENLFNLNINTTLFCRDKSNISDIRLKLIDYKINLEENIEKKDLDTCKDICDNTLYKSSKILLSKEKYYSSKSKWKANQPLQKNYFEKIVDDSSFWAESEHFKLFNIKNHG